MCGRYTMAHSAAELRKRFDVDDDEEALHDTPSESAVELKASYNVAPTQLVPIVLSANGKTRRLEVVKWGLIPFWTKDAAKHKPLINARADSLAEKASFKSALKRKRCIIPADGFYEWKNLGGKKIPMHITKTAGGIIGFAGIYDDHRSADGEVIRTCSIITTEANGFMSSIHSRMPAILDGDAEEIWLDTTIDDVTTLCAQLKPAADDYLKAHPVSSKVNSAAFNSAECIEEMPPDVLA